ncbi:unnamed protein product [marine sediment metagenome]|uniref:Uncharacterized protein n=1 Tax=marine sediment metagenome TaxID=412755 RepID=X1RNG3_9ZZZZ
MRKIDQLKELLESQEFDPDNWTMLALEIEDREDHLLLADHDEQVGFAFDKTGEKFLGIVNWKE